MPWPSLPEKSKERISAHIPMSIRLVFCLLAIDAVGSFPARRTHQPNIYAKNLASSSIQLWKDPTLSKGCMAVASHLWCGADHDNLTALSSSLSPLDYNDATSSATVTTPYVALRYRSDFDLNGAEMENDEPDGTSGWGPHGGRNQNGLVSAVTTAPTGSGLFSRGQTTSSDSGVSSDTNGLVPPTVRPEVSSVISSVTHWCDIMRQEKFLAYETVSNTSSSGGSSSSSNPLDIVLSNADVSAIEGYWDRIMPTVSYLGTVQVAKIYQALCVAYRAHRGQMRKSGEPFIVHVRSRSAVFSGEVKQSKLVGMARRSHFIDV
jgi:hypothetical protein